MNYDLEYTVRQSILRHEQQGKPATIITVNPVMWRRFRMELGGRYITTDKQGRTRFMEMLVVESNEVIGWELS